MKVKSSERGKSCKRLYKNIRWFNNFNLCLNNINKKINEEDKTKIWKKLKF